MAVLQDGDFELDGYLFSGSRRRPLYVQGMELGGSRGRVQDTYNPIGTDILFGRDYKTPSVWGFRFRVGHGGAETTLSSLAGLTRAWDELDTTPGAESVLRYAVAGRTRLVYGRARDLTPAVEQVFSLGRVVAEGGFQPRDVWFYDDLLQSVSVTLVPPSTGGLLTPLISPLSTVEGSQRQGLITVGGDAPAPVEVIFRGPVSRPKVKSSGWEIELDTTIPYGMSVTVNARTGTVLRSDGASLGGALTRKSFLPDARLKPGAREIQFSGTDITGTATCTVRWRNTFRSF